MTLEQFTTELKCVRNVSPMRLGLYGWTFKAFARGLDARTTVVQRIGRTTGSGRQADHNQYVSAPGIRTSLALKLLSAQPRDTRKRYESEAGQHHAGGLRSYAVDLERF
jgi:hypothetical protein